MSDSVQEFKQEMASWWATEISDIAPGSIRLRGHDIEELMAEWDFVSVIGLMLGRRRPSEIEGRLLNAALVASVDHGPQAPSIAAARMAATCGVGLNNAVATGVNLLGDTHGGAGQQCVELLYEIDEQRAEAGSLDEAVTRVIGRWRTKTKYLPGFGHRFHPRDPRRDPMIGMLNEAVAAGAISGKYLEAGLAIERNLSEGRARPIPMNIDGATAIVYAELGFPAPLARGLFVLARSVGLVAHAWEETQSNSRIKGPMPKSILPSYVGPNPRA